MKYTAKKTFLIYFLKRFFLYTLAINSALVILLNVVEFFEKLMRVTCSNSSEILHFLWLNLGPSFFEQLPTSTWLATGLLLKELYQQQEFETLQFIGFTPQKLCTLFLIGGISIASFSIGIHEYYITPLVFKVEQFKAEKFRSSSTKVLINKWMPLDAHTFCHFELLHLEEKKGNNIFIITLQPSYIINSTLSAPQFEINNTTQEIILHQGNYFDVINNTQEKFDTKTYKHPSFFSQITFLQKPPSIAHLSSTLFLNKKIIPYALYNDLFAQLCNRLTKYLLLILYPFFTCILFCFYWRSSRYRWLSILIPYPFFLILNVINTLLVSNGIHALIAYSIWLISLLGILISYKRLL